MNGTSSAIFLAGWCLAAILNYGLVFGHFQRICGPLPRANRAVAMRHRRGDMRVGALFAALGPAAWLVFLLSWILGERLRLRNIRFW